MFTNNDVFSLYEGLSKVGNLPGAKFAYAVAKNQDILKREIDFLKKTVEPSPEFVEYDKKRVELAKKHAKKDDRNNPVISGNAYDIENQEEFNKELDTLKKEHEAIISQREAQIKEFEALLSQENKTELHTITANDLPRDITPGQLSGIIKIIAD